MSHAVHGPPTTYRLHLVAPFEQTSNLAEALAQMDDADPPAISTHETGDPLIWALDAYYQSSPDLARIKTFLETVVSPLPQLELSLMANEDWVARV